VRQVFLSLLLKPTRQNLITQEKTVSALFDGILESANFILTPLQSEQGQVEHQRKKFKALRQSLIL